MITITITIDNDNNQTCVVKKDEPVTTKAIDPMLFYSIDELSGLTLRSANCLKAANIYLIGDLVHTTESELRQVRDLGDKSIHEIRNVLGFVNLTLNMNTDGWAKERWAKEREKYEKRKINEAAKFKI